MSLGTELQFHVLRKVNPGPREPCHSGVARTLASLALSLGTLQEMSRFQLLCTRMNLWKEYMKWKIKRQWIRTRNQSLFAGLKYQISNSSELKWQRWILPDAFPLAFVHSWEHGPCLSPNNRPGPPPPQPHQPSLRGGHIPPHPSVAASTPHTSSQLRWPRS